MTAYARINERLQVRFIDHGLSDNGTEAATLNAFSVEALLRDVKTGQMQTIILDAQDTVGQPTALVTRSSSDTVRFELMEILRFRFRVTPDVSFRRGQLYVIGGFGISNNTHDVCRGYLYSGHDVNLGDHVESGPGGGEGATYLLTLGNYIAGNVATTFTPATTNTFRKMYGFVWYYNADANAASRVLNVLMRGPWGALPVGFGTAAASDIFAGDFVTLTLSEEGTVFQYRGGGGGDAFQSLNDNGVVTMSAPSSNAIPWPLLVREDDPFSIIFTPTAGLAGDRYSVYALIEEWLVL